MPSPARLARLPVRALPGGLRVAAARGPRARLLGLARLDALPPGLGLHLDRCRSIHTLGMRFALDLLWLDDEGRVVRLDPAVGPRRHRACRGARGVLEVGAGEGARFAAALAEGWPR